MNFRPRLHEALLSLTKTTANELNRVDREDADVVLVVRMEVGAVMRPCRLSEHTDDDPEESGDLWHRSSGSPETATLSPTTPNDLSHSENFTLPAFSRSTSAFRYVGSDDHTLAWRSTRRMQVNA
jgi:hypothetical protein